MTPRPDGWRVKNATTDYDSLLESERINGRLIQPTLSSCKPRVHWIGLDEKECTLDEVSKLTRYLGGLAIPTVVWSIVYADKGNNNATSMLRIRLCL